MCCSDAWSVQPSAVVGKVWRTRGPNTWTWRQRLVCETASRHDVHKSVLCNCKKNSFLLSLFTEVIK
jgi:23S rRNA maturation-related 3'-5' exoribonuclease YhaM